MKNWLFPALALLLFSCNTSDIPRDYHRSDFPDIFTVQASPASRNLDGAALFFDQGAWFGYALADGERSGFSGPFMLQPYQWLAKNTFGLAIRINNEVAQPDSVRKHFYPGMLRQDFYYPQIQVTQRLIYSADDQVVCFTDVKNNTHQEVALKVSMIGEVFNGVRVKLEKDRVVISDSLTKVFMAFADGHPQLSLDGREYALELFDEGLGAQQATEFEVMQSDAQRNEIPRKGKEKKLLEENETRWNNYLNDALATDTHMNNDSSLKVIGVKSVVTLLQNWRSARGDLKHDGLFPSYAYRGFHGFWAWDSWKHAIALASFHPDLAKDQMRAMFDFQDEQGMVADCIYPDKAENNYRNTKPPLAGWAAYKVYEYSHEGAFLMEMYPKLKKYHAWWYQYRDHDKDSLCEYGCTDGSLIAAKWESGMDNAERFDKAMLLQNAPGAYSLDQESVDLNTFLYLEKMFLANIGWVIGQKEDAMRYESEANALKKKLDEQFYDDEENYFFDKAIDSDTLIKVKGPEAWIAMYANVARYRDRKMTGHTLFSDKHFNTRMPFPTLDADRAAFDPENGYWRGPVWIDQAFFAIQGMRNIGLWEESNEMFKKLLDNAEGLKADGPIFENYHPMTGEGLNAPHFSWSAAYYLLLHRDER